MVRTAINRGTALTDAKLSADMTSKVLTRVLCICLIGRSINDVESLLEKIGAKGVVLEDLANPGIKTGYDLDHGVRAGDPVLVAAFGLARGWFRADRPAVAIWGRSDNGDNLCEGIS